jgi:hypothetical protein
MDTIDRSVILAHYRAMRIAADKLAIEALALEHGQWLMATHREPLDVVTARIKAIVATYKH